MTNPYRQPQPQGQTGSRRDAAGANRREEQEQEQEDKSVPPTPTTPESCLKPTQLRARVHGTRVLQKGQLFRNGRTRTRDEGHYRTENCTKQEMPPEDRRLAHVV